ncbi:hypothetical protein EYF80_055919 [Liparis tanakae]|uniref:Uncharacterized protein n=1 Tax=Liparis tanakae TaxID=230148 RepID=A0A4Z2EZA3_9TELE|nr:hypothetical protein EYF80_055919 [Liparis tanakae]
MASALRRLIRREQQIMSPSVPLEENPENIDAPPLPEGARRRFALSLSTSDGDDLDSDGKEP